MKLFPWKELRAVGAASQAVVAGMVMSKRVSDSRCYYGAAAQSKSLYVCHLESEQKQARREVQATKLPSQLGSVHHGYRAKAFSHSQAPSIMLSQRAKQHCTGRATQGLRFSPMVLFGTSEAEQPRCSEHKGT